MASHPDGGDAQRDDRTEQVPEGEGMLSGRERRWLVWAIGAAMAIALGLGAWRGG